MEYKNLEKAGENVLAAVKGIIHGNIVEVEDDIRDYDGADVVVTVLNYPNIDKKRSLLIGTAL